MRYILVIFSAFLFSFTVISCAIDDLADKVTGSSSDDSSSDGSTGTYQLATNDYANGVATDSSGNVYLTGGTKGGLDGNTSVGNTDLFVVKYNSSGTKQWTEQLGSESTDTANGVATDSSGNVYLAGVTYGGLDGNSNEDNADLFVVKYSSSGTKQWTKQLGTGEYDEARGVATDSSGNVYVVGGTKGRLNGISNSGRTDVFVIKFNSSGTRQWTKPLGTAQNDLANGVSIDSSGNFYVAGVTYKDLDGNTSAGSADLFVAKYNSSGTKQWTKQLGSSSPDYNYGRSNVLTQNTYKSIISIN